MQFSDSGVSPFNGMQFHYFGSIDANEVSKLCIIKFFTQQLNEIYDMTNNLKIIISVRRGGAYFFWSVYNLAHNIYFEKICAPPKDQSQKTDEQEAPYERHNGATQIGLNKNENK